ncbi:hypothetical protein [Enterococcus ureilyticus]|uniref:hypothetical protein n=1 Tax=Enterococcus ureilyticus TaxID=1131292 RepID=UPI0012FD5D19|nr:hypothetical protein [Enterococcus ureilyticus]MBM7690204.1 hypothetical protein [Enterococcus ureilyticus]
MFGEKKKALTQSPTKARVNGYLIGFIAYILFSSISNIGGNYYGRERNIFNK